MIRALIVALDKGHGIVRWWMIQPAMRFADCLELPGLPFQLWRSLMWGEMRQSSEHKQQADTISIRPSHHCPLCSWVRAHTGRGRYSLGLCVQQPKCREIAQLQSSLLPGCMGAKTALWRQPRGWCGPWWKWVWHPWEGRHSVVMYQKCHWKTLKLWRCVE